MNYINRKIVLRLFGIFKGKLSANGYCVISVYPVLALFVGLCLFLFYVTCLLLKDSARGIVCIIAIQIDIYAFKISREISNSTNNRLICFLFMQGDKQYCAPCRNISVLFFWLK